MVIIYLNDEREVVEKDKATGFEVYEYDDNENLIARHYDYDISKEFKTEIFNKE